jgi:hypothetical protein
VTAAPARPASGRVFWTGQLQKGQTVSIETQRPSLAIIGRFPGGRVRVRVLAAEVSGDTAKVYTSDPKLAGVSEEAGARNAGKQMRYVFDSSYAGAVTIVEAPTQENQWKLVLRSETRRLSAIAIDWELVQ